MTAAMTSEIAGLGIARSQTPQTTLSRLDDHGRPMEATPNAILQTMQPSQISNRR